MSKTQGASLAIQFDAQSVDNIDIDAICRLRKSEELDERVVWANIADCSSSSRVREVAQAFGFHELIVEDILGNRQRPKVETYGNQLFLILRLPDTSSGEFESQQVSILVCHHVVLTFHAGGEDCFQHLRARIEDPGDSIRGRGPDYLVYALFDAVVDTYFPVVERIAQEISDVERRLAEAVSVDSVTHLQALRSTLFVLQETIEPHREVVSQLGRETNLIDDQTRLYLRDVSDHLSQVLHATETHREQVADLRDYCFAELSFSQNETMKILTIVASVFIPLSFVVGLYGMNFDPTVSGWNMPELKWKYGYLIALCLMAAIVALSLGGLWWLNKVQRASRANRFMTTRRVFSK
ncbi:magnesium/cobalt transporter CorA [Thalassoglobus sp.]|uniref:magnesium/cobalt transporter CorA n=1 Tax=Thalassoglobus sp. TaxID=2795869 RepID=UPI003AA7DC8B